MLTVTSLVSAVLLALHISQDIVFGFDRAGLNHLVGVGIILVIVCGTLLLPHRQLGRVIMLLGGVMSAGMLPLHMRHGLRSEFLQSSGALLFIWTLYLLGVLGFFSIILAVLELPVGHWPQEEAPAEHHGVAFRAHLLDRQHAAQLRGQRRDVEARRAVKRWRGAGREGPEAHHRHLTTRSERPRPGGRLRARLPGRPRRARLRAPSRAPIPSRGRPSAPRRGPA